MQNKIASESSIMFAHNQEVKTSSQAFIKVHSKLFFPKNLKQYLKRLK